MKKLFLLSLILASTSTFMSCQTNSGITENDIPLSIVFEKWNIQFGQVQSMDVKLTGKNKSGEAVEVKTLLRVNQYDEFLLPMLTKLEEEDQFKDGGTGSGKLKFNKDGGNARIFIEKVGNMATENMEFFANEEVVALFMK